MPHAAGTWTGSILIVFVAAAVFVEGCQDRSACEAAHSSPTEEKQDSGEPLRAVAKGNNAFARNFYDALRQEPGNLVESPLSVSAVLALAWLGAGGATADQLRSTLQLPHDAATVKSGYKLLLQSLQFVDGSVELDMANKVYVQTNLRLKEAFNREANNYFLAEAEPIDFSRAAAAAGAINRWVEQKTRNRIHDLIKPEALSAATALVLVNAIYFKGTWLKQFDKERTAVGQYFHANAKEKVEVSLMYTTGDFHYAQLDDLEAKAVRLPYVGDRVSMLLLVPNEIEGLSQLESKMAKVDLERILRVMHVEEVHVYMPKFKIETSLTLNDALTNMGLGEIFAGHANFSGIAVQASFLSRVVQKAFIEVNEEGSEAAAATGGVFVLSAGVYTFFRADRPFMFFIIDDQTKTVLFQGRFTRPEL